MRILHVVPTYVPAWRYGGPIVSVHGLCRALVGLGHEVSVLTTTADGPDELSVAAGRPMDVDGVEVTYFRCDGIRRLYWSSALRRALDQRVCTFDVVHAHSCFLLPPTWAARAATRRGVPYVFSPRGMLVPELIDARSGWAKRAWISLVDGKTLRDAAAVHVTSERERDDLSRVVGGIGHQVIVPNGVDWPEQLPPRPQRSDGLSLLCLGRVSWKKGIDIAIRALPGAPTARLRVVGNDEEGLQPKLRALAAELGVEGRVDWLGPLYGADRDAELSRADALLLPSLSENFGNAVLEAMAFGVPVICTPAVGAGALVAEAGAGLVVEREVAAFTHAIATLDADVDLRLRMGEAGRAATALQGWPRRAGQMAALYERIQTRKPS